MNDAAIMSSREGGRDLHSIPQHRFRREAGVTQVAQRLSFDQFHYDVQFTLSFADLVNGADIGMGKGRGGTRLLEQILAARRIRSEERRVGKECRSRW